MKNKSGIFIVFVLLVFFLSPSQLFAATDTEAPQVEILSVEPQPARVGEQVTIRIHAQDESGVDHIVINLVNASNYVVVSGTFRPSALESGDDKDGIYSCTLTIPENAVAGSMKISGLAFDIYSNMRDYYGNPFDVESDITDSAGPQVEILSVEPQPARIGGQVTIWIHAQDESGVDHIVINLVNTSYYVVTSGSFRASALESGDEKDGIYSCTMTIPGNIAAGSLKISGYAFDIYSNMRDYYGNPFDVEGDIADSAGPQIEVLSVEPQPARVGQQVTIRVHAQDESGVDHFAINLVNTSNFVVASGSFRANALESGDEKDGIYSCTITIPDHIAAGSLKISGHAFDIYSNMNDFYAFEFDVLENDAILLSDENVADIPNQVYTGESITPPVEVTIEGTSLTLDQDYTVEYQDNVDVGTATIKIIGKGHYTGTITKTFEITPQKATPTVTLSATAVTYNAKTRRPSVTVKVNGKTLSADDYDVKYASGRKNVGKYKVTVTLKGNYIGSKSVYFKINPKGTTLATSTAASKAITVKWKKQSTKMSEKRITGYQIQLATDSKFTKNKKTVTISGYSKTSKKVTGLKGKKKYYIRIRTYKTISGTKYYSPWSKVKTVTTKA